MDDEFKENYTKIFIEKLVDENNDFKTSLIILRDEDKTTIFPVAVKPNSYKYLKNISNDINYEERFLCDIVYDLDRPKRIIIDLKNYEIKSFYINQNNEKKSLNIIELMSFAIRYSINIYIENELISVKTQEYISIDENKRVDLYGLDRVEFENSKH